MIRCYYNKGIKVYTYESQYSRKQSLFFLKGKGTLYTLYTIKHRHCIKSSVDHKNGLCCLKIFCLLKNVVLFLFYRDANLLICFL